METSDDGGGSTFINDNNSNNNNNNTGASTEDLVIQNPLLISKTMDMSGIMSNETFDMLVLVVGIILIFIISSIGTVLNIFNLLVFVKQGLKDAVNITLFGLAVADLGSVVTLLLMSGAYVLHFFPNLIHGVEIRYLTGFLNWPHATFVRVACLLTTFVAFERCLCVVIPLHVHRIITPTVAKVYNVFILTFIICIFATLYNYSTVGPLFLPHLNRTIIGIGFTTAGRQYAINMSFIVGATYIASFILVAALSTITTIKLNQQARWRKKMAASGSGSQQESMSLRNRKVVKMVVVISVLFIACTAPGLVNTILYIIIPDYKQMRRYDNLYTGTSMINFALEALNSTLNFVIYFYMSSNFSATFNKMMGREGAAVKGAGGGNTRKEEKSQK